MDLIPEYLNFIRYCKLGRSPSLVRHSSKIISSKKCLELFSEIAEDKDNFFKFYEACSRNLKLHIHKDAENSNLTEFLGFFSSKLVDEQVLFKGQFL